MSTPVNSEQDPVEPRDERLLHWRFHFADGEMWAFGSSFDARVVAVVRRARRIDAALALCAQQTREVLWRAYGARPDPALAKLSPQRFVEAGVLVVQPLLCNLVELAPEAARLHAQSGSTKPLRQWLERLSAKSGAGRGSATAVQAILAGARRLLAAAGAEYADAKAGISALPSTAASRHRRRRGRRCAGSTARTRSAPASGPSARTPPRGPGGTRHRPGSSARTSSSRRPSRRGWSARQCARWWRSCAGGRHGSASAAEGGVNRARRDELLRKVRWSLAEVRALTGWGERKLRRWLRTHGRRGKWVYAKQVRRGEIAQFFTQASEEKPDTCGALSEGKQGVAHVVTEEG
jgi:hypothetical protein